MEPAGPLRIKSINFFGQKSSYFQGAFHLVIDPWNLRVIYEEDIDGIN